MNSKGKLRTSILILIVLIWTMGPFSWVIISSIAPLSELIVAPLELPSKYTFFNYWQVFTASPGVSHISYQFRVSLFNSLIVALAVTAVCLLAGSFAGYGCARCDLPFADSLIFIVLLVQMVPPVVVIIPLFRIFQMLGLLDTRICLILVYSAFNVALVSWIMRGFFESVPEELEEAAMIDGCTRVGAMFRVIMPISAPGLFSAGILAFILSWNEFLMALVLTNTLRSKTTPVAISEFIARFSLNWNMMCTVGVIAAIPPLIVCLGLQKYIIAGLTGGAVKG